ncbi:MAG: LamG-like jellyroll fold domain-containing protein [Akkermansiaceae bacterium]
MLNGGWYHIVATTTHNGGTELFVNGISVASASNRAMAISDNGTDVLWIRNNPQGGANRMWGGQIADVAMCDRVLTQQEVQQIYDSGQAGISLGGIGIPVPANRLLGSLGLLALLR